MHDALGSVRRLLDDAGVPVGAAGYSYTPFGLVQSGAVPEPFGFTGELQDAPSGLVYLRARWYDPNSGTFTSRDPFAGWVAQPYSLHPYQYAYSNPVRYRDPTGEEGWEGPPWLDALAQCTGPGPQPPMCAWNPWGREPFHEALEEGTLDATQTGLDGVGTVDVSGPVALLADGLNACISYLRGDYTEAALSAAGVVPFLSLMKWIKWADEAADVARLVEDINGKTDEIDADILAAVRAAGYKRFITHERLQHSFRHAEDWFGREVFDSDLQAWEDLIRRASRSTKTVPWTVGNDATVGHLARIEGKYFFVQYYTAGEYPDQLATAFIPDQSQLSGILRRLREQ